MNAELPKLFRVLLACQYCENDEVNSQQLYNMEGSTQYGTSGEAYPDDSLWSTSKYLVCGTISSSLQYMTLDNLQDLTINFVVNNFINPFIP